MNKFQVGDYFKFESATQMVAGMVTDIKGSEHMFKPLCFNDEWARHNFHGLKYEHAWHASSPFHKSAVKITAAELQLFKLLYE